jgi:hypothetical protein
VQWWLQFLRIYNGLFLIPDLDWSEPDSVISTDACLKGLGGINFITNQYFHVQVLGGINFITNQYFHVQVPDILNSAHISILEMYAVYIALQFLDSKCFE